VQGEVNRSAYGRSQCRHVRRAAIASNPRWGPVDREAALLVAGSAVFGNADGVTTAVKDQFISCIVGFNQVSIKYHCGFAIAATNHQGPLGSACQSVSARGERLVADDELIVDGVDLGAGATAKLAYDKNGHAMLMADKLPKVPQGKAYQLWFIVGKNPPMPGKTFVPDDTGKGMLEDQVPAIAMDSAVFAITMEPVGGVDAPTGPIYLRSSTIN